MGGNSGVDAWWYVAIEDLDIKIDLPTISKMAFIFGGDDGMDFLARCGILKKVQDRYQLKWNREFCIGFMLEDVMEYTQQKVSGDSKKRYYIFRQMSVV